jgi:hypothetical protein
MTFVFEAVRTFMRTTTDLMRTLRLALVVPLAVQAVEFNRDIRPILADHCFKCHGADSAARKADLRLDVREAALRGGKSGISALLPGQPEQSELIRRITTQDENDAMPPVKAGKRLSGAQVAKLREWIAGGAEYQAHWAFLPPRKTEPPRAGKPWGTASRHSTPTHPPAQSVLHPLDAFILARLAQEGLDPSPEADRGTLLRRVSFDLSGLPPTPEEVRAFQNDTAPDAYEKWVDRLLATPRYGEHFAALWLDWARYADTSGFQGDPVRTMWRWRDYVIESFNANKPFDRFTLEQIAGDLLPDATLETRLATGFHRNHRFNTEFGSIEEEWMVENVVDRVETVSAAWLGLTLGCARCHDHKFDPVTQRDFYSFFAFFNNVPERGVFWDVFGEQIVAFEPNMRAPTPPDETQLRALQQSLTDAEAKLAEGSARIREELATWHPATRKWEDFVSLPNDLVLHLPFDDSFAATFGVRTNISKEVLLVTNQLVGGQTVVTNTILHTNVTRFEETLRLDPSKHAGFAPGILGQALIADSTDPPLTLSTNLLDQPRATLAFWIRPETSNGIVVSKMGRQTLFPLGLSLSLTNARLHLELAHEQFDFDGTMVPVVHTTEVPLPMGQWSHVAVAFDGNRMRRGPVMFVNGAPAKVAERFASTRGLPGFANAEPLRLGGGDWRGRIDDFRVYDRPLTEREVNLLARLPSAAALAVSTAQGTEPPADGIAFYRDFISPWAAQLRAEIDRRRAARDEFESKLPLVMVMAEKPTPATARVLNRGMYDQPREEVRAGVPLALGKLPPGAPPNRLGLARWLTAPDQPLTARVFVNRLWEQFFGIGLVRSSENLGAQAEPPSHPELLDWLAAEFAETGWDVKRMVKLIVMSGTYRQASAVSKSSVRGFPSHGIATQSAADTVLRDSENRLLWRGPRFRLSAETIRDRALFVSGLLHEKVGGPSVTPYLPGQTPKESPDLYRRSLYSIWQRTRLNPSMAAFDAPSREACTIKRPRTNTPLQALALLNEVTYIEAARKLAERMMRHSSQTPVRLRRGFELALARLPDEREVSVLETLLVRQLAHFRADPAAADRLLAQGVSRPDAAWHPPELAAYAMVASALMNTDEFVTKE